MYVLMKMCVLYCVFRLNVFISSCLTEKSAVIPTAVAARHASDIVR